MIPVKIKQSITSANSGICKYLTTIPPTNAERVIRKNSFLLFTIHGCLSAIQAPITSATISGKIISFSPVNSAIKTIIQIKIAANKYLPNFILFKKSIFIQMGLYVAESCFTTKCNKKLKTYYKSSIICLNL